MAEELIINGVEFKWHDPVDLTVAEYGKLSDIVGSLVIAQFDDQEEYRQVIGEIFRNYLQSEEAS